MRTVGGCQKKQLAMYGPLGVLVWQAAQLLPAPKKSIHGMNRLARELVVSQQRLVQAEWRLHEVNLKCLARRNVAVAAQTHV